MRDDIGQGETRPGSMWVLFDRGNGDAGSYRYLWWFRSRAAARAHMRRQHSDPRNVRLSGPFRYLVQS